MDTEPFEYINAHGKRVTAPPQPSTKRRYTPFSAPAPTPEQPSYLTLQLLRKPYLESVAQRQLARYRQQLSELTPCYQPCD